MKLVKSVVLKWWSFILVLLIFTVLFSSVFYLFLNFKFYYTGAEWNIRSEANIIINAIDAYLATNNDSETNTVRKYISRLISKDKSYIMVECLRGDDIVWTERNDNQKYLDGTRDVVHFYDSITCNDFVYNIQIMRGNRPHWYTQLYRAWTFSLEDYLKDKDSYIKSKLYYRTMPLVLSIFLSGVTVLSSLMFIRKLSIDGLRQLHDFQDQLTLLNESRSQMVSERNAMSTSLSKLEIASKLLYNENINLKNQLDKLSYYETVTKSLEGENDQLKEYHDKARLLFKEYKTLKNKVNDDSEYMSMMEEEITSLKDQIINKDIIIENKTKNIIDKENEITDLQKRLSLNMMNKEDVSTHKKIEKALKAVLPRVLFTKHAVKQIVTDAPLSDVVNLETMSQLLVALENGYEYEELCKKYTCNNMKDNDGIYRLKKGDCRVYFYFIPNDIRKQSIYKNTNSEVVYILYKKKQNDIPDYVKNCKPSWYKI